MGILLGVSVMDLLANRILDGRTRFSAKTLNPKPDTPKKIPITLSDTHYGHTQEDTLTLSDTHYIERKPS
jgi:hypothetical protein